MFSSGAIAKMQARAVLKLLVLFTTQAVQVAGIASGSDVVRKATVNAAGFAEEDFKPPQDGNIGKKGLVRKLAVDAAGLIEDLKPIIDGKISKAPMALSVSKIVTASAEGLLDPSLKHPIDNGSRRTGHGVSKVHVAPEYLYIKRPSSDGLGTQIILTLPGFQLAAYNGWSVICKPSLFQSSWKGADDDSRIYNIGHMGRFFGCDGNWTLGRFVPLSDFYKDYDGVEDESYDEDSTWKFANNTVTTKVEFSEFANERPAADGNQHPLGRRKVHIVDICKTMPKGCTPSLDNLQAERVDIRLGIQFIRDQFNLALKNWNSPSETQIWGDGSHRVAIHLRRGDLLNEKNNKRMLSSGRAARLLKGFLAEINDTLGASTSVAIIAETSLDDPELKPLREFQRSYPRMRMQWFLGRSITGADMETEPKEAQERLARDLFIMGSSTALVMSASYCSLLGACLQRPTALRFAPVEDEEHEVPKEMVKKLGWSVKPIPASAIESPKKRFQKQFSALSKQLFQSMAHVRTYSIRG